MRYISLCTMTAAALPYLNRTLPIFTFRQQTGGRDSNLGMVLEFFRDGSGSSTRRYAPMGPCVPAQLLRDLPLRLRMVPSLSLVIPKVVGQQPGLVSVTRRDSIAARSS